LFVVVTTVLVATLVATLVETLVETLVATVVAVLVAVLVCVIVVVPPPGLRAMYAPAAITTITSTTTRPMVVPLVPVL